MKSPPRCRGRSRHWCSLNRLPICSLCTPGLPPDDADPFNQASSQAHVLMTSASPFRHGDFYDDEYEECKLFRSDGFDNRSQLTSNQEEITLQLRFDSYALPRNMFQNVDKEGLITKEALGARLWRTRRPRSSRRCRRVDAGFYCVGS
jgi:hypothetical protein